MNYTVLWQSAAEEELAQIWVDASNRNAVRAAADRLDTILGQDPYAHGESRTGLTRIMFVEPLAVLFEVQEQDRLVSVRHV
jgi:hypothetical protein